MMLNEVKARVTEIADTADDPEQAHRLEDTLYRDVLKAIATGQCRDYPPEDFAAEALRAGPLRFPRWYA
jgi:hypothetical protein